MYLFIKCFSLLHYYAKVWIYVFNLMSVCMSNENSKFLYNKFTNFKCFLMWLFLIVYYFIFSLHQHFWMNWTKSR